MFNIYFLSTLSSFYTHRNITQGAIIYDNESEGIRRVITQTGKASKIFTQMNEDTIAKEIAQRFSPTTAMHLDKLISELTHNKVRINLPPCHDIKFRVVSLMESGDRVDPVSSTYLTVLEYEFNEDALLAEILERNKVKILSPDIILPCDVGIRYDLIWRGVPAAHYDYYDMRTATYLEKLSFMESMLTIRDENKFRPTRLSARTMCHYGLTDDEIVDILKSGSGLCRLPYTIEDVDTILTMRLDHGTGAMKLTAEVAKEEILRRRNTPSSEGGYADLVYCGSPIQRSVVLNVIALGETQRSAEYPIDCMISQYEYFKKNAAEYIPVSVTAEPFIKALTQLLGINLGQLKSIFGWDDITGWSFELYEVKQLNPDEPEIRTLLEKF